MHCASPSHIGSVVLTLHSCLLWNNVCQNANSTCTCKVILVTHRENIQSNPSIKTVTVLQPSRVQSSLVYSSLQNTLCIAGRQQSEMSRLFFNNIQRIKVLAVEDAALAWPTQCPDCMLACLKEIVGKTSSRQTTLIIFCVKPWEFCCKSSCKNVK